VSALTAYVNGRFVPLDRAQVHIEDRGFQFADSVYEVIACYGGTFLDLPAHLRRLEASCTAIDIPLPCPQEELAALIGETCRRNPFHNASAYVQVTRGVAPRSLRVPEGLAPTLVITCRELPFPPEQAPAFSAITLRDFRWGRCDIKTTALLASVLGRQEAVRHGAEEAFWTDADGHVLEGAATNVLAVIDNVLVTHPLDRHVLGGITRGIAMQQAVQAGIRTVERPWKLSEPGISECMMTSTLYALAPVCRVDGKDIGSGRPGPLTLRLRRAMLEHFRNLGA
jgi:D-alanine transaminase